MPEQAALSFTFEDCLRRLIGFTVNTHIINTEDRNTYAGAWVHHKRSGTTIHSKTHHGASLLELYQRLAHEAEMTSLVTE